MSTIFADAHLKPSGHLHHNLPVDELIAISLSKNETKQAKNGALVVYTGAFTGRSPQDRFIVDTPSIHDHINWGEVNRPISSDHFDRLYKKMTDYLSSQEDLYVFDGWAGADEKNRLSVRMTSEYAYQALFTRHLLRRTTPESTTHENPGLTVLVAPNVIADPATDGTRSETFIVLNFDKKKVLIGGTKYSGEIKKSVFTVMNYALPEKGIFPMHCSANIDAQGKSALFFGLSGTGKTTLSADPARSLIGDDEHGWGKTGIFNFEGGCYAKCIDLKQENEPQIYAAIKKGALLENVVLDENGEFDFANKSLTENTRAAYPLDFIDNTVDSGMGTHPSYIIFLTADAFGVLPPVAKLDANASMYHFLSGYTSKLAGTERGITEPKAVFSTCFGAPFMPRNPLEYAELLKKYMTKYDSKVYLVNTGWCGGAYGVGQRISIKDTRAIIHEILGGKLDTASYRRDSVFNLDIPQIVAGVDHDVLNPRVMWSNEAEYDEKAKHLVSLFVENFKKFKQIPEEISNAGPHV